MEVQLRKKLGFMMVVCALFLLEGPAHGQQIDAALGVGTVTAASSASASGNHAPQTIGGGTYIGFSGDVLFKKSLGVGGEVAWRAHQNLYQGFQPFRPIFFDFNGVFAPQFGNRVGLNLMAGIGAETARFYQPVYNCTYFGGCTNYVSTNHFMGHFGGGVRFYPKGNFFISPEAHVYLVRNNQEFSSAYATRFDISIGYTFRFQQQ
jgi:hypothetical protein